MKIKVKKTIRHDRSDTPFTWAEIKAFEFEDNDIVGVGYDEGYYSENNSWGPHHYVNVTRMVEETDEQEAKRLEGELNRKADNKKRRYENYLHLKKEFEQDDKDYVRNLTLNKPS